MQLVWNPVFFPGQGSANLFRKEPDSKYFRLCRPYSLCHNCSIAPFSRKTAIEMNGLMVFQQNFIYKNKQWAILAHRPYLSAHPFTSFKMAVALSAAKKEIHQTILSPTSHFSILPCHKRVSNVLLKSIFTIWHPLPVSHYWSHPNRNKLVLKRILCVSQ